MPLMAQHQFMLAVTIISMAMMTACGERGQRIVVNEPPIISLTLPARAVVDVVRDDGRVTGLDIQWDSRRDMSLRWDNEAQAARLWWDRVRSDGQTFDSHGPWIWYTGNDDKGLVGVLDYDGVFVLLMASGRWPETQVHDLLANRIEIALSGR